MRNRQLEFEAYRCDRITIELSSICLKAIDRMCDTVAFDGRGDELEASF